VTINNLAQARNGAGFFIVGMAIYQYMTVYINGVAREFSEVLSVHDLLCALKMDQQRLAIEINGEILPRRLFADTVIKTGDHIEIVHAIGGG
jgi:thiamine biosynthesis protein ThiS